ncbi:unnamed protein product [Cyprideis torosa]|uniref:Ubiquitin conjugation factor E4 A n=1 Tax=Cyprideis torosa TaxID=163714 RepID=A0A7R8ZPT0_9CRUS|nr:unnamed protein product [Cyprideis torosa]CAG0890537.1 unnamed protein product [Cyprideis torosa]
MPNSKALCVMWCWGPVLSLVLLLLLEPSSFVKLTHAQISINTTTCGIGQECLACEPDHKFLYSSAGIVVCCRGCVSKKIEFGPSPSPWCYCPAAEGLPAPALPQARLPSESRIGAASEDRFRSSDSTRIQFNRRRLDGFDEGAEEVVRLLMRITEEAQEAREIGRRLDSMDIQLDNIIRRINRMEDDLVYYNSARLGPSGYLTEARSARLQDSSQPQSVGLPPSSSFQPVDRGEEVLRSMVALRRSPIREREREVISPPPSPDSRSSDSSSKDSKALVHSRDSSNQGSGSPGMEDRDEVTEALVVPYLFGCYVRLQNERRKGLPTGVDDVIGQLEQLIFRNLSTSLQQPELFMCNNQSETLPEQFKRKIVEEHSSDFDDWFRFVEGLIAFMKDEEAVIRNALKKVLELTKQSLLSSAASRTLIVPSEVWSVAKFFARSPQLGLILIEHATPAPLDSARTSGATGGGNRPEGLRYQDTLIGALLSVSALPPLSDIGPFWFFNEPSNTPNSVLQPTEARIHACLSALHVQIHELFYALLKLGPAVKNKVLHWFASCLEANANRRQSFYTQMGLPGNLRCCSDGMMLNLMSVLLRFSLPFSQNPPNPKSAKIDPLYSMTSKDSPERATERGLFMRDLCKETSICSVGSEEEEQAAVKQLEDMAGKRNFTFITNCFYVTHRAIDLGFHVVMEKYLRLNQDASRHQRMFQDMVAQGSLSQEQIRRMREMMDLMVTRFLCYKAVLFEPTQMDIMLQFCISTTIWLASVATRKPPGGVLTEKFIDGPWDQVSLPLQEGSIGPALRAVPEFVASSIVDLFISLKRFSSTTLDGCFPQMLDHLVTFVLVFMGNKEAMKNPHLRARLAECLEALLPDSSASHQSMIASNRESLFVNHPHIRLLAPSLLAVFVSIEVTGQSDAAVAFEEKFNYRSPMYEILKHIWTKQVHREVLEGLATEAFDQMEEVTPPIFLQFINLLMNDAIFLLDEALSYMSQIRNLQRARRECIMEQKSNAARDELRLTILLLAACNLGPCCLLRVRPLFRIDVALVFCHSTLVDRIAAMLNYFLVHLVGPKKKNLKKQKCVTSSSKLHTVRMQCPRSREIQTSDDGEWRSLAQEQQVEHERNLRQVGLMARFHNQMGKETIGILEMLIRAPSVSKVKDFKEFHFAPGEVVTRICEIYLHLRNDENFVIAVISDGRSYSEDLFIQSVDVLMKIHRGDLATEMQVFRQRLHEMSQHRLFEEELQANAPDEFLDPIMNTLMRDPVLLPSSNIICDRSTIARLPWRVRLALTKVRGSPPFNLGHQSATLSDRLKLPVLGPIGHLLSDQHDPFNRSPLTMNQVKSATDLKTKIETWIAEKREEDTNKREPPASSSAAPTDLPLAPSSSQTSMEVEVENPSSSSPTKMETSQDMTPNP